VARTNRINIDDIALLPCRVKGVLTNGSIVLNDERLCASFSPSDLIRVSELKPGQARRDLTQASKKQRYGAQRPSHIYLLAKKRRFVYQICGDCGQRTASFLRVPGSKSDKPKWICGKCLLKSAERVARLRAEGKRIR
jgi:hypothetical protein